MKKLLMIPLLSILFIMVFVFTIPKTYAYTQDTGDFYFEDIVTSESISGGADYVGTTLNYTYDSDYKYIINVEKNPDNATMFDLFGNQNITITVTTADTTTYYDSYTLDGYLYGFFLYLPKSEFDLGTISVTFTATSVDFPGSSVDIQNYMTDNIKVYRISELWFQDEYPPGRIYYYYYQSFGILQPEYVADENYQKGFDDGYRTGYDSGSLIATDTIYSDAYSTGMNDMYNNGSDQYGYTQSASQDYQDGYNSGNTLGYNTGFTAGQDDIFNNGSFQAGYILENAYDYLSGYQVGSQQNVNAGVTNFLDDLHTWIVPAIIIVILLGGFTSIAAIKKRGD